MSAAAPEASGYWPITLVLPDGQRLQVRLLERQEAEREDGSRVWMHRIAAPMWQAAPGPADEAMAFTTWVTAAVLEPFRCVAYFRVPTHRIPAPAPEPTAWGWALRRRPGGKGAVLHDSTCELVDGGTDLSTEEALDALMRPGVEACTRCDAGAVLVPALELGQGYG
ncbi:DUF6233 domain-containing protein [Streptomyces sp. NPDC097619]|uniref:DUF6233 domain-containing protein n=1 Tax=Streptomyces sp. NPDC097619 TaxID=3157228 RepID=UPI00333199D3